MARAAGNDGTDDASGVSGQAVRVVLGADVARDDGDVEFFAQCVNGALEQGGFARAGR